MASIVEIVSYFNSAKQQAIVWHHQTTSKSEHEALEQFYTEIVELLDGLSESYAGIYGRLKGYDVEETTYNRHQFNTLYFNSAADKQSIEDVRSAGYDMSNGATMGQIVEAKKQILARDAKANTLRLKQQGKL